MTNQVFFEGLDRLVILPLRDGEDLGALEAVDVHRDRARSEKRSAHVGRRAQQDPPHRDQRGATLLLAAFAAVAVAFSSACLAPYSTTTAYDEEKYVCGTAEESDWRALARPCPDVPCGGFISFRGQLEGKPVKVTATTENTSLDLATRSSGVPTMAMLVVNALGPYFSIELSFGSFEGPIDGISEPRELAASNVSFLRLPDDLNVSIGVRLSTGGSQVPYKLQSGTVSVTAQSRERIDAAFDLALSGGELEGCMAVVPSQITSGDYYVFD